MKGESCLDADRQEAFILSIGVPAFCGFDLMLGLA
jgi:hypothetical protein